MVCDHLLGDGYSESGHPQTISRFPPFVDPRCLRRSLVFPEKAKKKKGNKHIQKKTFCLADYLVFTKVHNK